MVFFLILSEVLSDEQEKIIHYSCEDGLKKICRLRSPFFKHLTNLVMLIGDLWDGFFYPTLILMIDDYNPYITGTCTCYREDLT